MDKLFYSYAHVGEIVDSRNFADPATSIETDKREQLASDSVKWSRFQGFKGS